jgi:hypothetical protein
VARTGHDMHMACLLPMARSRAIPVPGVAQAQHLLPGIAVGP